MTTKLNFTDLFKEEKDIYIQNLANGQVSLQFGRGEETLSFLLTRKRDPIVLTNHVPFKLIVASTDFRRILNRHPAIVRLLTEEEYNAYYKVKAKQEKITPDVAIAKAESERLGAKTAILTPKAVVGDDEEDKDTEEKVNAEEAINGRVIHLCHQASNNIPVTERMKPNDLLEAFKDLQNEFKMDDYEYILANTGNKSIHTWAKSCQKLLMTDMSQSEQAG